MNLAETLKQREIEAGGPGSGRHPYGTGKEHGVWTDSEGSAHKYSIKDKGRGKEDATRWPVIPSTNYFKGTGTKEDWKNYLFYAKNSIPTGTKEVKLSELRSSQKLLYIKKLHDYVAKLPKGTASILVMPSGAKYVMDGHHRLAAARIRGEKTATVQTYRLNKKF